MPEAVLAWLLETIPPSFSSRPCFDAQPPPGHCTSPPASMLLVMRRALPKGNPGLGTAVGIKK